MLALLAAWCIMLASRNAWTPDEPRELALAASQVERLTDLPRLGGATFAEKPPLSYWLSGLAMREFGVSAAAARFPLLLYAIVSCVAVYLLGRRLGTHATGIVAALIFATEWQVFGVQIWLATDALLLAGVTLALLGVHLAFGGVAGNRHRWSGCTCLYFGLALALFAKNFAGWLVPVSTLFCYLAFERRLHALLQPACWLPVLGSLALLLLWARSVADSTGGSAHLHALFWDNLAGRLASFTDSSDAVRALGHRNWPGKYLVELPVYLLPWTAVAVGAVVRLWRDRPARSATSMSWRFALCACVPGLIVLSLAATARGTYAATILPGVALFIAVLITFPRDAASSPDIVRGAILWNVWLVLVLDCGLLTAICTLQLIRGGVAPGQLLVALLAIGLVTWICLRCFRPAAPDATIIRLAGAHVVTLIALSLSLVPLLNQWQDQSRIAQFIEDAAHGRPMILWLPDETALAMSDLYLRKPVCVILFDVEDPAQRAHHLTSCLRAFPGAAVLAFDNWHDPEYGFLSRLSSTSDPLQRVTLRLRDATLTDAGVEAVAGIVRPGGRAYLVGVRSR